MVVESACPQGDGAVEAAHLRMVGEHCLSMVAEYWLALVDSVTVPTEYDAILRNLAVIGEAVGRYLGEVKSEDPTTPWASIQAGLRKVVIHDYFKINPDLIRDVVDNDLAAMAQSLRDGSAGTGPRRWRRRPPAANAVIDESTSEIRAGTHQNVLLVLCPQGVWLLLLGVPAGEVSWTGQCHHDHGGDAPDHRQMAVADRVTDDLDISDRGTAARSCRCVWENNGCRHCSHQRDCRWSGEGGPHRLHQRHGRPRGRRQAHAAAVDHDTLLQQPCRPPTSRVPKVNPG